MVLTFLSFPTMKSDSSSYTASPITSSCVLDAPHPIADVLDGAQQIANDVIAGCH